MVAYHYIEGYQPQAYNLTKTLSKNEAENVFTFVYEPVPEDTVTTETEVITRPDGTTGTAGGNAGQNAGTTTGGNTANGDTQGTTEVPDEDVPQNVVDLDDEDVPLDNKDLDRAGSNKPYSNLCNNRSGSSNCIGGSRICICETI